jgi:hypothetical protein
VVGVSGEFEKDLRELIVETCFLFDRRRIDDSDIPGRRRFNSRLHEEAAEERCGE